MLSWPNLLLGSNNIIFIYFGVSIKYVISIVASYLLLFKVAYITLVKFIFALKYLTLQF